MLPQAWDLREEWAAAYTHVQSHQLVELLGKGYTILDVECQQGAAHNALTVTSSSVAAAAAQPCAEMLKHMRAAHGT
jgi:hypothetical protein